MSDHCRFSLILVVADGDNDVTITFVTVVIEAAAFVHYVKKRSVVSIVNHPCKSSFTPDGGKTLTSTVAVALAFSPRDFESAIAAFVYMF